MSNHQYFQHIPHSRNSRIVRDVSLDLINTYFRQNLSRTRWLKQNRHALDWFAENRDESGNPSKRNHTSKPFNLSDLDAHVLRKLGFDHDEFNLFPLYCSWLDSDVGIAPDFHFMDAKGDVVRFQTPLPLGNQFPVLPCIDREGQIYSSLQGMLNKSVIDTRERLILESVQFTTPSWFNLLRMFIADSVSSIDILLHHIYTKAEFDPLPGWCFDKRCLGDRTGRRLSDKLRWVGQITGRPLDDADEELQAFHRLRKVRNHLQHFDPPCFGFSLEDVASWINSASKIGRLAWKIRKRVGSPLTSDLVALVVTPNVCFIPKHLDRPRKEQLEDVGYASTCWPCVD